MLTRRRLIASSAAAASGSALARAARADAGVWPNRPVHLIVPLAAGGPTDTLARLLADRLSQTWNQQVVVDNKPGGGTNVANEYVAHAEPDGYTALYATSSLATNVSLYRALSYDPVKDLAPVSLVAKFPFFMIVPNSSPAKTVADFIADAKAHPGKRVMASPGTGSAPHLAEILFMQMAGITMIHAPYRGAAPALVDLMPGRVDCYFGSGELLTYARSGQVRALATTGAERSPAEPDLPTIAEALPGYAVDSWQGVFLPAKTPAGIVSKMSADTVATLARPEIKDKLARDGYAAQGSSPDALRKWMQADAEIWTGVIKTAGIKID
jgi:tripartite-type tricarboxylate transporter receptor subunit TctC